MSGSADGSKTTTGGLPQHTAGENSEPPGARPPDRQKEGKPERLPEHKEKISATRKRNLVRQRPEVEPEHFHRYRCAESPSEKQFIYFAPSKEGPTKPHRNTNRREVATES